MLRSSVNPSWISRQNASSRATSSGSRSPARSTAALARAIASSVRMAATASPTPAVCPRNRRRADPSLRMARKYRPAARCRGISLGVDPTRAALVTGTRRIGGAIARALAADGYDVAVAYRESRAEAEAAAAAVRAAGRRAVVLQADLADPAACRCARRRGGRGPRRPVGGRPRRVALRSRSPSTPSTPRPGTARWPSTSTRRSTAPRPRCRTCAAPAAATSCCSRTGSRPAAGRATAATCRTTSPSAASSRSARRSASSWPPHGIRVHVIAPGPIVPAAGSTAAGRGGGARRDAARALGRRGRSGAPRRRAPRVDVRHRRDDPHRWRPPPG